MAASNPGTVESTLDLDSLVVSQFLAASASQESQNLGDLFLLF